MISSTFRVLVLGDFHYGESYRGGGQRVLREHGYGHSTQFLRPFFDVADKAIVNLEAPLARKSDYIGKFSESKEYIHWADPARSGEALAELGVTAVGLANNHTVDLGSEALESTFRTLDQFGISWFGAGINRREAEKPHHIKLPRKFGGGSVEFYAAFEYRRRYRDEFSFYAKNDRTGCASISRRYVPSPRMVSGASDSLRVAFPHWGPNYVWRSDKQEDLALKLLTEGYDMILGHGAHSLQEIHRLNGRWVAYSIGNSNFQSPGRWSQYQEKNGIVPFGFWTMIEVLVGRRGTRSVVSKLYPVYLDNKFTNFQPQPVASRDFAALEEALRVRQPEAMGDAVPGQDDLGYFFKVDHGEWPRGGRLGAE